MCWWVRITSSMSSSEWPSAARPLVSSSNEVAEFGPGVDERERLVLDQVDVHPPDRERRRDRVDPVDPVGVTLTADQLEHLVALLLHVLAGDERLEVQPQQRLGVRGPHVEVPVVVVDRDAVELAHPPSQ